MPLAELKRAIGRLARSDGNDGALAAELTKLNEEYAETRNWLEEVGHPLEALGSGGPAENDVRKALQKLDPLWHELFPAEKERIAPPLRSNRDQIVRNSLLPASFKPRSPLHKHGMLRSCSPSELSCWQHAGCRWACWRQACFSGRPLTYRAGADGLGSSA